MHLNAFVPRHKLCATTNCRCPSTTGTSEGTCLFIGRGAAVIPGHACLYGPSLLWHLVQELLLGLVILSSFHRAFLVNMFPSFPVQARGRTYAGSLFHKPYS